MSFKEVTSLDADNTIALGGRNKKTGKNNPTSAEGYFLGTRQVKSPKSKTGLAAIHFLQTPKGNLGIWGKTDMDRKLSSVAPGTMIRVSFDKMVPTPNGDMYKFKVEVDSSNTIEVDLQTADTSGGSAYGDDGTEDVNTDEDESDLAYANSRYDEEEVSQSQALSSLERKQKVEALLKGAGRPNRK